MPPLMATSASAVSLDSASRAIQSLKTNHKSIKSLRAVIMDIVDTAKDSHRHRAFLLAHYDTFLHYDLELHAKFPINHPERAQAVSAGITGLTRLLKIDPLPPKRYLLLGKLLQQTGQLEAALAVYRRGITTIRRAIRWDAAGEQCERNKKLKRSLAVLESVSREVARRSDPAAVSLAPASVSPRVVEKKNPRSRDPLLVLPPELCAVVFAQVPPRDLLRCMEVSGRWRSFLRSHRWLFSRISLLPADCIPETLQHYLSILTDRALPGESAECPPVDVEAPKIRLKDARRFATLLTNYAVPYRRLVVGLTGSDSVLTVPLLRSLPQMQHLEEFVLFARSDLSQIPALVAQSHQLRVLTLILLCEQEGANVAQLTEIANRPGWTEDTEKPVCSGKTRLESFSLVLRHPTVAPSELMTLLFEGSATQSLKSLPTHSLRHMWLSETTPRYPIRSLNVLRTCQSLQTLHIENLTFNWAVLLELLASCPQLEELTVRECREPTSSGILSGNVPFQAAMAGCVALDRLRLLDLVNCAVPELFVGQILQRLGPNLEVLRFPARIQRSAMESEPGMTELAIAALEKFTDLKEICWAYSTLIDDLRFAQLGDYIRGRLEAGDLRLTVLDFSFTNVTNYGLLQLLGSGTSSRKKAEQQKSANGYIKPRNLRVSELFLEGCPNVDIPSPAAWRKYAEAVHVNPQATRWSRAGNPGLGI